MSSLSDTFSLVCVFLFRFSRQGSVIVSFNVSYMAIDSLQIVSLQEYIEAGGKLADSPTELLSVTSSNGTCEVECNKNVLPYVCL